MLPNLQTIDDLKADLTKDMTKRDLLIELNDGNETTHEQTKTCRKDGQIERQDETLRDVETNEITGTKNITWSYYKTGEVDEITITEGDTIKVIKHYLDRQPTVTNKVIEPIIREVTR